MTELRGGVAYLGVTGRVTVMQSHLGGEEHNIAPDCGVARTHPSRSANGLNPVRESVDFPTPRPVRRPSQLS